MMNVTVLRDRDGVYVASDRSEVLRSSLIIGALRYGSRKIYIKDVRKFMVDGLTRRHIWKSLA